MELAKGVAIVMDPVLPSHVSAVMVWTAQDSGLVNRVESGADSSLDAFVSIAMKMNW